jgi:tryptophan halogenase
MFGTKVKKIVIVGGGTAGWMAASYLSKCFKLSEDLKIVLVESDQIGTVGVGEATVPGIHHFIRALDINERDFIAATNATFKLGIEFEQWSAARDTFFHPFGGYGISIEEDRAFYKTWVAAKSQGFDIALDKFCLGTQLARSGKFALPNFNEETRLAWYNYAYHFDATLFAKYLRAYSEARGVQRIEGKVSQVVLNPDSGFISKLIMESELNIEGDVFIDCTGLAALLIGKTLNVEYLNWEHWLPCNTALAVQTKEDSAPDPYTKSTSRSAGWQWHIPLQNRVGNGYVYCDKFITDDDAQKELLRNLKGEAITSPRIIRFKTGARKEFWHKNCVSIGLSSGFLEPLESTSISLIQTGIAKFASFLVDFIIDEKNIAEANRVNLLEYERIRDFIILHYKLSGRTEPFWHYVQNMDIPSTLQEKIDWFLSSGDIKLFEQESFVEESWISMFYGFGLEPKTNFELKDPQKIKEILARMASAIGKGGDYALSHMEFIKTI